MSVEKILQSVERDKLVYEVSGGGITFSGGEPFLQSDFLLSCLKAAKKKGFTTAVETTANVKWALVEKSMPYVDDFLVDIKHMESGKHNQVIGCPNEQIISNLLKLSKRRKKFELCMPLIPGFNDDRENLRATAALAAKAGLSGIKLLPYHSLGKSKYNFMGLAYKMEDEVDEKVDSAVKKACEVFEESGINVILHG